MPPPLLTPISLCAAVPPPSAGWINPMEFSDPRSLFQDIRLRELNGFRGITQSLSTIYTYINERTYKHTFTVSDGHLRVVKFESDRTSAMLRQISARLELWP